MEWAKIETAPEDGTVVDLWHKDGFRMTERWYVGDLDQWCGMPSGFFTHWVQILPPTFTIGKNADE